MGARAFVGADVAEGAHVTRFAGAERGSRVLQFVLNLRCGRVRATEDALGDPFRLLERRHGLAEIVERGAGVAVERLRVASQLRTSDATLDDHREAVTTLEETERTARQVFGSAHPMTKAIKEHLRVEHLRVTQAALRARSAAP